VRISPGGAAHLAALAALLFAGAADASAQVANEPDPFASRFDQHTNFQIKFNTPEKGGEVRLYTKNPVHFEKDQYWEGSEEVVIEYQDIKITADSARYDFPTKTAVLTGHVVIDQGPTRMSGTRGTFHLDSKTGVLEDATADLPPTFHIVGSTIEKIGPATYRIKDGLFTACDMPNPEWSFTLSEATITLDEYARMKNVAFRAGTVPVLWTPYLIWPTKEDRASGMLVPGIGWSNQRGAYLGLSYFWVTGRSTDQTFHLDAYTDGSIGGGWESRWRPTDESAGLFQGYIIRDQNATVCLPVDQVPPDERHTTCFLPNGQLGYYAEQPETRWKLRLDHVSDDLPFGFRGVLSIRDYSDQQYLQDYERSFALNSARQIVSRGFLTKNFGADSLNFRFERSETFYSSTVIQERFPSIEFFHRTAQIGPTPFFLSLQSSLSALYLNRGRELSNGDELTRGTYGRFDAYPIVSFPFKEIPWLSLTARAGGRVTYYTNSVNVPGGAFNGDSFTRTYAEGGVSFVGPSFSRIYDTNIGPWDKFKHVIEPRVDYQYVSDVDNPEQIPAFDEIDTALGRNQIRYAIVNRLLARTEGQKGSAEEIASLEIAQTYLFDPPQTIVPLPPSLEKRKTGPYEGILRISRPGLFNIDGRILVDPYNTQLTAATVTAGLSSGSNYANFSWFGNRPLVTTPGIQPFNSDQFRFNGGMDLGKYFRVDASVAYDSSSNLVQEDRGLLTYKGSCYTVFLEVRQLRLPPNPRNDYRLVVNLKDIGTILDVNGSIDALFGP
jgi:LPS-assembly protein